MHKEKAGLVEIHLEATLNTENFYQRCGFTGSAQAVYNSSSGLQLACVPMRKQLVDLTDSILSVVRFANCICEKSTLGDWQSSRLRSTDDAFM